MAYYWGLVFRDGMHHMALRTCSGSDYIGKRQANFSFFFSWLFITEHVVIGIDDAIAAARFRMLFDHFSVYQVNVLTCSILLVRNPRALRTTGCTPYY